MPKSPQLVTDRPALRQCLARLRSQGATIGFVPTMGALHAGHLSLVEASNADCDATVVSIFVNPAQFGPREDFSRYPRSLEADLAALAAPGADLVFAPSVEEIYRPGHETYVEVGPAAERWEGAARPGHFRGVATVVLKLLQLVQPEVAFFGQKDYQQCLVVRKMVDDFDVPTEIRICPTVRDADGLAMSSRNVYLAPAERASALALSRALRLAEAAVAAGQRDAPRLVEQMSSLLAESPGVSIDYVAIADRETLEPLLRVDRPAVALVAARVASTRLIDNSLLNGS